MSQRSSILRKLCIIIMFLMPVTTWAQKLKWVFPSINYIDLVDKSGNTYIADRAYYVQDIDPGPGITNINGTYGGTFLVKYDSIFNLKWYKTSQLIEMNYSGSIMTAPTTMICLFWKPTKPIRLKRKIIISLS